MTDRWSLVLFISSPLTTLLSIKLANRYSVVVLCTIGFGKSILKSLQTNNIFFLFMTLYSPENISLNVSIQDPSVLYTQFIKDLNLYYFFLQFTYYPEIRCQVYSMQCIHTLLNSQLLKHKVHVTTLRCECHVSQDDENQKNVFKSKTIEQ